MLPLIPLPPPLPLPRPLVRLHLEAFCELEDIFALVARCLSPVDLFLLSCCSLTTRRCITPVLVEASWWSIELTDWLAGLRNTLPTADKLPFVRRLRLTGGADLRGLLATLSYLKQLTFDDFFDQPLGEGGLPASLAQLTFGYRFNQPLGVGVLPVSLAQLTFGDCYDQPFGVNVLPPSLTQLTVCAGYNWPLDEGVLPAGCRLTQPG